MRRPVVSVIVPCHNAGPHLEVALQSILNQTFRDTEIIVVDDGSTDSACEIVSCLAPMARLLRQSNRGAAAARNAGLAVASGEYIAFLDADDWWHPRKLETQLAHLWMCGGCGAVYARWRECASPHDANWLPLLDSQSHYDASAIVPGRSGWLYRHLLSESVIHTSSVLFRRRLVDQIGLFDEDLIRGQDLDYWIRSSRLAELHKLDCVLSAYRIYRGSATTRITPTNYRALIIERAVQMWGLVDPAGVTADPVEITRVLQRSWEDFGYAHLKSGSPRIALQSFARAQSYARSMRVLRLKLQACAKLLVTRRDGQLDPRHEARLKISALLAHHYEGTRKSADRG